MGTASRQLQILWEAAPVRLTPAEHEEAVELLGQLMVTASRTMQAKEGQDVGSISSEDHR